MTRLTQSWGSLQPFLLGYGVGIEVVKWCEVESCCWQSCKKDFTILFDGEWL